MDKIDTQKYSSPIRDLLFTTKSYILQTNLVNGSPTNISTTSDVSAEYQMIILHHNFTAFQYIHACNDIPTDGTEFKVFDPVVTNSVAKLLTN
jgi:hypothetical protein